MKILLDIGHPAHVHYFRNFIEIMKQNTHTFIIVARNREVIFNLLEFYKLEYTDRGLGKDSKFGKLFYIVSADFQILKLARRFKPDIYLSFSSPYAAHIARLLGKPHIAMNDTEHTDPSHKKFTYPFSEAILTPKSYQHDLGNKHLRFNGIMEGFYLYPKYFKPDSSIHDDLKIDASQEYVVLRFVSWKAHHDYGQSGLDKETIWKLIRMLEKKFTVFISSEAEIDAELKSYKLNIAPEKMHSVLANASMFIGESGTMASESAYLGTFAVYINSLPLMCYLKQAQDAGLLKHFSGNKGVLSYVEKLIQNKSLNEEVKIKAEQMKSNFIDATAFLVWFIENYPESSEIMKKNPDYQYRFK